MARSQQRGRQAFSTALICYEACIVDTCILLSLEISSKASFLYYKERLYPDLTEGPKVIFIFIIALNFHRIVRMNQNDAGSSGSCSALNRNRDEDVKKMTANRFSDRVENLP